MEHQLGPQDAGGDIVLVVDPVELEVQIDAAVRGASVLLNGEKVGTTPTGLKLDLCRPNRVEVRADGYRPASAEIPSGAGPLDARKLVLQCTRPRCATQ